MDHTAGICNRAEICQPVSRMQARILSSLADGIGWAAESLLHSSPAVPLDPSTPLKPFPAPSLACIRPAADLCLDAQFPPTLSCLPQEMPGPPASSRCIYFTPTNQIHLCSSVATNVHAPFLGICSNLQPPHPPPYSPSAMHISTPPKIDPRRPMAGHVIVNSRDCWGQDTHCRLLILPSSLSIPSLFAPHSQFPLQHSVRFIYQKEIDVEFHPA